MLKALLRLPLLLLVLLLVPPAASQEMPTATVVLFDAVCLTCHEGECSGRMALRTERGDEGLAGHVAAYAGRQDDGVVSRLKTLMGRLKTECRMPVPSVAVPADGQWGPESLAPLTLADRRRIFLPLGQLPAGPHSASLRLDSPQRLRLQVVADSFDIVLDEESTIGPTETRVRWQVDEPGPYFLRILGRDPIGLLRIGP